jgi:hypothetical protein
MCLPEFFNPNLKVAIFVPGREIAEIHENLDCRVVAFRLLSSDQGLDLAPQLGLASSDTIKALFPGDGSLMLAARRLLGSFLGLNPASLLGMRLSALEQFANSPARR